MPKVAELRSSPMSGTNLDVVDEFRALLNDASAVFGISRSALPTILRQLQEFARVTGMQQDELIHLTAAGRSPSEGPGDAFAAWPLKHLPGRLANHGTVARQAGHQWVVSVYHLWENRFREEIALDRGLDSMGDLKNQHMADLARFATTSLSVEASRPLRIRIDVWHLIGLMWVTRSSFKIGWSTSSWKHSASCTPGPAGSTGIA